MAEIFSQVLNNLMEGIVELINEHKKELPERSKCETYPTILWSLLPEHKDFPDNWLQNRLKFNHSLEHLTQRFSNMGVLKLLKVWDGNDQTMIKSEKFTEKGLIAYWGSIDSAFRHWDTFISVKNAKQKQNTKKGYLPKGGTPNNFVHKEFQKFRRARGECPNWQNNKRYHYDYGREDHHEDRRCMPQPPY